MVVIPIDIISEEILPKLPTKSLLRFKCVSKSFRTLISSQNFIHLHLRDSPSMDLIIQGKYHRDLYMLDLNTPSPVPLKLPLPPNIKYPIYVLGSCNGLICLQTLNLLMLFNPSTRDSLEIPKPRNLTLTSLSNLGFGYIDKDSDYKIVEIFRDTVGTRTTKVYSLKANSWRVIEKNVMVDYCLVVNDIGTNLGNHLLFWRLWYPIDKKFEIGCFNLCTDQWEENVPFPPDLSGHGCPNYYHPVYNNYYKNNYNMTNNPVYMNIGVLDGCLCLYMVIQGEVLSVNVWIMKKYGKLESWVKLFGVSDANVIPYLRHVPLSFRRDSSCEILLRFKSPNTSLFSSLVWYNIRNKTTKIIEMEGIFDFFDAYVCKSSLVTI